MKIKITLILLAFSIVSYSQNVNLETEFDSIIKEANLLYNYEKVTWNASDLAYGDSNIKDRIGSYIVFHTIDSIHAVFADKILKNQIVRYSFLSNDLTSPISTDLKAKPLSKHVQTLFNSKNVILNNLNTNAAEYGFNFQNGFNPNSVLIPTSSGYKLYIIIGTANDGVIPFGNDYLFLCDKDGNVTEWKKFHKTLIPSEVKGPNNQIVVSFIHSHLKMTPHISATDICTFRLYGYDLFGMEEFKVLSTALNKIFTYNAKLNKITESEL